MTQAGWRPYTLADPMNEAMLCLEASAGTGKTYTIEGMVTRLVAEEGVGIERLLVVTFTVAATAELKRRVRDALRQARDVLERCGPEDPMPGDVHVAVGVLSRALQDPTARRGAVQRLSRAIDGFDEAQISTIHGFCQRALRENTFESGAPFGAELQQSMRPLLEEIAHDGWTRGRHDADPRLLAYLDSHDVSLKTLMTLAEHIADDPEMPRLPAPPPEDPQRLVALDAFDAALAALRSGWADQGAEIQEHLIASAEGGQLSKTSYKASAVLKKVEKLEAWLGQAAPSAASAEQALTPFSTEGLAKGRVGAFKTSGGVIVHGLLAEVDALIAAAQPAVDALFALSLRFMHTFSDFAEAAVTRRKAERRILSFSDLLKTLRARVSGEDANPALVTSLQGRYDIALIDEFQDTDPVQWQIFEAIFTGAGRRLIVVGDPKQAIYAFRGADIETYIGARSHPEMSVAQLTTNHRSDAAVVQGIGHLFEGADPFLNLQIQYTPVAAHHTQQRFFPAEGAAPGVVFTLLRREAVNTGANKVIGTWNWSTPQRIVAAQIVDFLQSGATIEDPKAQQTGGRRAVRPSDVAVLVRSNHNAEEIQSALRALGVPSTLRNNSSVVHSDEAAELIEVLEAVLTPRHAGQVRRALVTRLLGQDVSTLAALAEDEAGWTTWMERLTAWRRAWIDTGFATFARALTTTPLPVPEHEDPMTIPARLLGWRDGERRVTNLNHLIELLHEAALADDLTPMALIEWLKRERSGDTDNTEEHRQLRLESDGDAVTIVTVHKAKGLEYPFVWCPYLWTKSSVTEGKMVPLRFRDPGRDGRWCLDIGVDRKAPGKVTNIALANQTNLSEATRQLYVALTRAKHQVHILTGAMSGLQASGLGHLLHPGDGSITRKADDVLAERLQGLADQSGGVIALEQLTSLPVGRTLSRTTRGPDTPEARPFDRRAPIDQWWRRTSFSGLASNKGADEVPVQDHDAEDEGAQLSLAEAAPAAPDPGHDDLRPLILRELKGGARVGTCIHEIYEHHDFCDPDALGPLVARTLDAHRLDAETWADPVTANIQASLDTPLGLSPELTLAEVSLAQRFDELDFVFPLRPDGGEVISARQLGELMTAHPGPGLPAGYGEQLRRLNFLPVRGYMVGSVDLIFEHAGRWYVVDYKSNNLGPHPADYTPRHLAEAMSHSHYVLQYHIYAVALHRYLRWRLGDRYRVEEHFGGVLYLFIRGMSPEHAPGTGVFKDAPPKALVEGLSALLGGER